MAKKKKKREKKPKLTFKKIEKLLRQGAKDAEELDKTLKRVFTLTPAQRFQVLD